MVNISIKYLIKRQKELDLTDQEMAEILGYSRPWWTQTRHNPCKDYIPNWQKGMLAHRDMFPQGEEVLVLDITGHENGNGNGNDHE